MAPQNKNRNKKPSGGSTPQAGVYPDRKMPESGVPITDDFHVSEARDWVNHNKK